MLVLLINEHPRKRSCDMSVPLLGAAFAGLGVYLGIHKNEKFIAHAVSRALDEAAFSGQEDIPPLAMEVAMNVAVFAPPICAFALVYCLLSLVVCIVNPHAKNVVIETVPMGRPVDDLYRTGYVAMPPANAVTGLWSDSVFACTNDPKLCLTGCLFPYIPLGQLYERVMRRKHACVAIVATFTCCAFLVSTMAATCSPQCSTDRARGLPSCTRGSHASEPVCARSPIPPT